MFEEDRNIIAKFGTELLERQRRNSSLPYLNFVNLVKSRVDEVADAL